MKSPKEAADILRKGGVILYPTDTLYGLGVDALNKDALEKLYRIKGRDDKKPIRSIVASLDAAEPYAHITPLARALAQTFLPGPLMLLMKKKDTVPDWAVAGGDMFGIRIPNNEFCLALAREFGRPYTTTSANLAGAENKFSVKEILEQLGDAAKEIDLIIDGGTLSPSLGSTIVDASGEVPIIVREGAIQKEKVYQTRV